MKKLQLLGLFLFFFTGSNILLSCKNDEEFDMIDISDEDINSFEIIKRSNKSIENISIYGSGTVSFKSNEKMDFQIIDENTFSYDIAKNGNFDLLVKKENNFFIFYDSITNVKLAKAQLIIDGNKGALVFIDNYITSSARRGGWISCFEGKLVSSEKISLLTISAFGEPWSTAGFVSGVAISCAL